MPTGVDAAALTGRPGLRLTGPRRAVLEAVAAAATPFTAEELAQSLPGVGRATVFRTIRLLQDLDILCRVPLEDGSIRYQLSRGDHHHHLVCSQCGAVGEFDDPELDRLIQRNARRAGFTLASHSLELYGSCRACSPGRG
ncbi:MAG: transcriptional repressor [Thermoflexaceae bacterium]|nr:transcriptional repressor [Thermoflexaceae bacterium]